MVVYIQDVYATVSWILRRLYYILKQRECRKKVTSMYRLERRRFVEVYDWHPIPDKKSVDEVENDAAERLRIETRRERNFI